MKKLRLKALELGVNEVFSREQLKNVLGGTSNNTTTGCIADGDDCQWFTKCCNACVGLLCVTPG